VSFAAITLCVASQQMFHIVVVVVVVVVVYFVIDSVWKLLDTSSCMNTTAAINSAFHHFSALYVFWDKRR
jgi:hypothetical protein